MLQAEKKFLLSWLRELKHLYCRLVAAVATVVQLLLSFSLPLLLLLLLLLFTGISIKICSVVAWDLFDFGR